VLLQQGVNAFVAYIARVVRPVGSDILIASVEPATPIKARAAKKDNGTLSEGGGGGGVSECGGGGGGGGEGLGAWGAGEWGT
jgi:hypothetical protein